ncbi:MAG TPA: outer membrane protein assembly factor BamA [Rhodocyclaceae bacterium]|nr:outer membrane protein assembly factor BamA [Rhodocyclaceae bacterium]
MKIRYISAAILSIFSPLALALTPFVVKDIRVEGIQRTEAGTVFNYLPIKIGDTVSDDKVVQAIKSLYATGFFKDVRIESDKDVLVVIVEERPAIAQLSFSGNSEIKTDDLTKGLKDAGIAESRTFDRSLLDKAEQEIKRLYLTKSYYGVRVKTTVSPLERNRVAINFEIDEGSEARIKNIKIIGAKSFKEGQLLDLMSLESTGWFSWWNKNDRYSKPKLLGDLEEIKSYYLNRGYVDFNIDSTQVSITPDRKDVYITIAINEGAQYKVSSVKLAGDLLVPETELRKLVEIKPGEIFSRERLNDTSKALTDRLGNDGYAFANVNASPEVDQAKREVALTFFIDPGRRAYVNRINISGNNKSDDQVVRREMRQMEGAWFDREQVERSKTRLDRTGFFDEVNIDTKPVEGATDQVDLNVGLKERPTGNLTVGLGYSQVDKVVLSGSISQNNLFGSGNALSLSVSTARTAKTLALSYTNPYYTPDGVSRGFDAYHRTTDNSSLSVGPYKSTSDGGGVRFGVPIAEDDTVNFGLSADRTNIVTFDNSPQQYTDFVNQFGAATTSLLTTVGWARDKRDSLIYPTTGTYQRVSGDLSIPPGDLRYWRAGYEYQRFFALDKTFTLMLNGDFGYAHGYGGRPLPFFKNYFAGGIGSVRGYDDSSLGPKVLDSTGNVTTDALGGNRRIVTNAELLFPFPGLKEKDRSLRLSLFVDGGQVWGQDEKLNLSDMRWSTGVAMSWTSPIGPLKFSVAHPLNNKPDDKTQIFQFQIGSVF